jgi:nucleoid DNA-binding protein
MGKTSSSPKGKAPTKGQIYQAIMEKTGLSRAQVASTFDALSEEVQKSLNKGSGVFALPGLVKIEKKKVPARPARKNVPNPFKPGELMNVAAKPASTKIKVRALAGLKRMI